MSGQQDAIIAECAPLIAAARAQGKYLFCSYQQLWFSPDELTLAQANGKFCWGAVNWSLRDPSERTTQLKAGVRSAQSELDRWKKETESS